MTAIATDPGPIIFTAFVLVFVIMLLAALKTGRIPLGRWVLKMHYADRRTNPALFWVVVALNVLVLLGLVSMLVGRLDFGGWRLFP